MSFRGWAGPGAARRGQFPMKEAENFSEWKARLEAREPKQQSRPARPGDDFRAATEFIDKNGLARRSSFTPGGGISINHHLAVTSYWMNQSDGWHRKYRTAVYQVITLCVIGSALMVALAVTLACLVLR
jgi:hypothetical protein